MKRSMGISGNMGNFCSSLPNRNKVWMYGARYLSAVILTASWCILFFASSGLADEAADNQSSSSRKLGFGAPSSGQRTPSATTLNLATDQNSTSSVNLYTGQHVEVFPLVSFAGTGGVGLDISLDYQSNDATKAIKKENRESQASIVGLGFDIGRQAITVEHAGTLDLRDDLYKLITNQGAIPLHHIAADSFCTEFGDPWRIKRRITSVNDTDFCVGWRIYRENGLIYEFGDMDSNFDSSNATRTILRWGEFVGSGVTPSDKIYPCEWDLKIVRDIDSINLLQITYERDLEYLQVIDTASPTQTRNSQYPYVRSSRIKTITATDGSSLNFEYSLRKDYQQFWGTNIYEFFEKKKLDRIVQKNNRGNTLSKISFAYSYLNNTRDSVFQKLLLKSLQVVSGNDSMVLNPLFFEYNTNDTSSSFGCISAITYPTGGVKEITYKIVDGDANFTQLNTTARQSESGNTITNGFVWHGDNLFVRRKNQYLIFGYWEGYWQVDTLVVDTLNGVGVTDYGWFVYHYSHNKIAVCKWKGGFWHVDTMDVNMGRFGASGHLVRFVTGEDCFIATAGSPGWATRYANFYILDGDTWKGFIAIDDLSDNFQFQQRDVRVVNGSYLIGVYHLKDNGEESYYSRLYGGRYDWQTGQVDTIFHQTVAGFNITGRIALSTNLYGFITAKSCLWRRYQDGAWDTSMSSEGVDDGAYLAIAAMHNGLSWTFENDVNAYLRSAFFNGGGQLKIVTKTLGVDPDYKAMLHGAGLNFLATRWLSTGHYNAFQWSGKDWQGTNTIGFSLNDKYSVSFTGGGYLISVPNDDASSVVKMLPYLGNNTWGSTDSMLQVAPTAGAEAGVGFTLYRTSLGGDAQLSIINRYYGLTPRTYYVRELREWVPFTVEDKCSLWGPPIVPHGSRSFHVDFVERTTDATNAYRSSYVYRLLDTVFTGKAKLNVVDKIKFKNGSGDTNPIIQRYDYYAGIMDEDGSVPRFAKVKVSTPYYNDSVPIGWTVHGFYNDIDSIGFYDEDVYDAGISFPDLKTGSLYGGVENGGYRLDGMEYFWGFYNGNDSTNLISSSRTNYQLAQVAGFPDQIYRIQVAKVVSYNEGFSDTTTYKYDSTGQIVSTRIRSNSGANPKYYSVDSVRYAYKAGIATDDSIKMANALTLPYEQIQYIDSINNTDSTKKILKRTLIRYEKKGSWRPKEVYNWFNPTYSAIDSAIKVFSTMSSLSESYDAHSNTINSSDAMGVISSFKYDSANVLSVASAVNAKNSEWLYQDFEQGPELEGANGWDGWVGDSGQYKSRYSGATVFNGKYSYKIKDDVGSAEKNWGPSRKIMASALTDDLYYFSTWVYTNHDIYVYCWAKKSNNDTVLGGYKYKYFSDASLVDTAWMQIQDTFNLAAVRGATGFDHIFFQVVLGNGSSADSAYFDDIRFHPLDAQVSSIVYNAKDLPIASAGPSNIPVRTVYDSLLRPIGIKKWNNISLSSTQYSKLPQDSVYKKITASQSGRDSTALIIVTPQMLSYRLTISSAPSGKGVSYIYKNSTRIDSLKCSAGTCSSNKTDSFSVTVGDTVWLKVTRADTAASSGTYTATALKMGAAMYSEAFPNWTRQERQVVRSAGDVVAVVSKTFTDALGRELQTRTTQYEGGTEKALVSGIAKYDARGRAIKSYLPYYDLSSPMVVDSFSSSTQAITEINAYYDGNPGPVCNDVAFMESKYDTTFQSPLIKTAGMSDTYKMSSGKINVFKHRINDSLDVVADTTIDPDGNLSYSVNDRWGFSSKAVSKYTKSTGGVDSILMITYQNLRSDSTWMTVDTGVTVPDTIPEILLRWSKADGLGRVLKTWRVDNGTVSMFYDKAGRVRFIQNDKRLGENKFVYFKYDALGRKIEEGLEDSASTCFNQTKANDPSWPASANNPTVHYKWYYDYYVSGADVLQAMGKLVRVQSSDASYYRNYHYYPTRDSDRVVVKLPQSGGTTKGIIHKYNFDGSLSQLIIYPKGFSSGTGKRSFEYRYDKSGRLEAIAEGYFGLGAINTLDYAAYTYFPSGNIQSATLGAYNGFISFHLQKMDYVYNPMGMLTDINSSVDTMLHTFGSNKDHFAMQLKYFEGGDTTYYNGRVSTWRTHNTKYPSGRLIRRYDYRYNDLGWLRSALDSAGSPNDQRYFYNALGQRNMVITGTSDTTLYTYYTNTPGSSRLMNTTGIAADSMKYDTLGNLIADESGPIYSMTYDYRNLPTQTYVAPNLVGGSNNYLDFVYDETERRIEKTSHYQVWILCGGGVEDFIGEGEGEGGGETESEGGGGCPPGQSCDTCPSWRQASWYYLYDDDGTLLANFNESDSVVEMFVNGPQGRIASYYQNNNDYLNYYLTDHLGSTRLVMQAPDTNTAAYTVTGYYTYHPFGAVNESWINYNTKFKFTGKEHDAHTSFQFDYFGARYYDNRTGLFISTDKADQFVNAYLYGNSNPISMIDRNGLWTDPIYMPQLRGWYGTGFAPLLSTMGKFRFGGTKWHYGTDIYAPSGTPVQSALDGVVEYVYDLAEGGSGGYTIGIRSVIDGKEYILEYMHLLSKPFFKKGQVVKEGDVIAHTGATGNASDLPLREHHLHFAIKDPVLFQKFRNGKAARYEAYIPPEQFLDLQPSEQWMQTGSAIYRYDLMFYGGPSQFFGTGWERTFNNLGQNLPKNSEKAAVNITATAIKGAILVVPFIVEQIFKFL